MPKRKCSSVDTALGGNLVYYRKLAGLTQQQIADIAGIKLRHYQRVESGENHITNCTGKVMMRILIALKIDPFEFFPDFKK